VGKSATTAIASARGNGEDLWVHAYQPLSAVERGSDLPN
jgi:hypothetical protein